MTVSARLTISNNVVEVSRIRDFVETPCANFELAKETVDRVILAAEELVTNVIEYGYADERHHEIDIALSISTDEISVVIEDDARAFNPVDAPEPHLDAEIDRFVRAQGHVGGQHRGLEAHA